MSVIPALRKLRQEDCEFLGSIVRSLPQNKEQNRKEKKTII
jgi:hypothetical protein